MSATNILPAYPYVQYNDDPNIVAFFDAYNGIAQGYLDYLTNLNLPIYTQLSGALLDWVGQGLYGYARPTIGVPSGAIFGTGIFGEAIFGEGGVGSVVASDDIYQRVLTWKTYRGDGFYQTIPWLKRRIVRFLTGVNGIAQPIDFTSIVSMAPAENETIAITINYPSDSSSVNYLIQCINGGILDLPFQYAFTIQG